MTLPEIINNATSNSEFIPGMSSNELFYGTSTEDRLTDVIATVAEACMDKADSDHTHTDYAATDHSHTGYAAADHAHTGYAASTHSHTPASIGAAAAEHSHDYAASNHGHSYNDLSDQPTIPTVPASLPANGGNADTVDNKHASDFATASHTHAQADITGLAPVLAAKADLVDGKVPSSQLPSFVDDVVEYAAIANFPTTGEAGKIYVATGTNKTYRWSGTAYVEISASIALGETSATAYRGDRGKIAYDHSQNSTVHVTADQKTAWDSKAAGDHTHTPAAIGAATSGHTHSAATTSAAGLMSASDKSKLDGIATGANKITVDSALSSTSTNPVQNKVINTALAGKAASSHTHDYAASGHTHTPASIGAFPATGGAINGDVNVAGVLRVNGQQSFYFQTSTMAQTVGTNNATGGTTICCGSDAAVAINGALTKTPTVVPKATNAYYCGNANFRWKGIYSTAAVNVSSDERLKRDIAPMEAAALAAFIEKLNVVSFNYNEDPADTKTRIGLIAQDVQEADADLAKFFVEEDEDGMLGMTPADLVFPLIAAVQQLSQRVAELEGK